MQSLNTASRFSGSTLLLALLCASLMGCESSSSNSSAQGAPAPKTGEPTPPEKSTKADTPPTTEPSDTSTAEPQPDSSKKPAESADTHADQTKPSDIQPEASVPSSEPPPKAADEAPVTPSPIAEPTAPVHPPQGASLESLRNAIALARTMRASESSFPLVRTPEGFELLPDDTSSPLTNDKAIGIINQRLSLNSELERLQAAVVPSPTTADALAYRYLTSHEVESLRAIRNAFGKHLPADRLNTQEFAEINDSLLTNERAKIVGDLDQAVTKSLDNYGLRLIDTADGPALDPNSRVGLPERLKDRVRFSAATTELQTKLETYSKFLQDYGLRTTIDPKEIVVLNKVRVFSGL